MNEFIEQFLVEARELVDQASDDLLALEAQPKDKARLDSVFRAFHTLKGAAGIIEFSAMARALHGAEDVLASVRGGGEPVTPGLIGDCLSTLDQVVQWLDVIETAGAPPSDADLAADAIAARFIRADAPPADEAEASAVSWLEAVSARHPDALADARTAIRYRPEPGAFFQGEDPLAVVERIPGLLGLYLAPRAPWPRLDAFDPFACQLDISALSAQPVAGLAAFFDGIAGDVEIVDLAAASSELPSAAKDLLQAQILMLRETQSDGFAGRMGAAGRVAVNVLAYAGRDVQAEEVEQALARAQAAGDAGALIAVLQEVLAGPRDPVDLASAVAPPPSAARALRVDVERIDALVGLAGELTVIKNAVGHVAGLAEAGAPPKELAARLKEQHALLERLANDLQHSVLSLRVLPLRHVFQRFPRLVRELGADLGKPVRLAIEGDETEADKAIVEGLFEPLLHVLRNALDHGLEGAEERRRSGKSEVGVIHLRASRHGEHVLIEVEDDGRGVDAARVRQVAAQRGVASDEALAVMSEAEVADLIFAPGFSTARQVTDVSGRGVGMDAVRTAVMRMGGRVSIDSRAGQGTIIRFTLPFTVMMSRVMTVEAGGQMFGIPLDAVIETARVARDDISSMGAAQAFVLRDRVIPLVDLAQVLGADPRRAASRDAIVVVTQAAGLEVDRLGGRMDVMLKPMGGLLSGMPGVSGTTLLGDGRVLIVLDIKGLLQ